ncbi:MAG: AMP-binding protein, partial [Methanobrevibacter sp.]|nr:AMP-binding protein [Methanobrevibacter sp.]
ISYIDYRDKIDSSSVGFISENTKIYILDSELRRVPYGAVGELYIAGHQVSEGYLNREDETRNAFIDNPFDSDEDYGIMYRSGDMARLLPDGSLGFIGRRDGQVKIRGNRVELSEIEDILRELDYVEDVTVQTVKDAGNRELVAYVVVKGNFDDIELKDLISSYVGERKPEFMVPSFVVSLDKIPLTINGKVDKRALPEIKFDSLRAEYVAPVSETERKIVDAFEQVFNQKEVSLYDDFVRLGGDSIKAIRVISLLQKDSVTCTARDILNYKTPYLIAQNIEEDVQMAYDATEGTVDMLPIQKFFFNEVNRNNLTQEFILESFVDLDKDILQKSWDKLTDVHDMLRARYETACDEPVQEILPLNTRVCEINEFDIDDLDEIAKIRQDAINSIDISSNLMDVSIIRHEDKSYLLIVIHHLIVDGVSWSIILDDLTYIYNQMISSGEINLSRPYPYKLWVKDVEDLLKDISDEEKEHWININALLDDSSIKGKAKPYSFNIENIDYDADNLLMLSEEEFLALAIARAYKNTYDKDIIFNRESYGRDESLADVNRTVGWFTSQYPILVGVEGGYDSISLASDAYRLKKSFNEIRNLGLNYSSLIYDSHELEFRHSPVSFNFLSTEFSFKNELFKSFDAELPLDREICEVYDEDQWGIDFNVSRAGNDYIVGGNCAEGTYIDDKLSEFIKNIKSELEFIVSYGLDDIIACPLTESQLGIYLDEMVNDKGTAYSGFGVVECGMDKTVDEIKTAILSLIDKHPVLRGRIYDEGDTALLVCDATPEIVTVENTNIRYSELVKSFDLEKSLSRFFIIDGDKKEIVYDIHHVIHDATSSTIINRELVDALDGNLDTGIDLGFVYASRDSFESQFKLEYESAHEFFRNNFAEIDEVKPLLEDVDGSSGVVSLPIRGVRSRVEEFAGANGITVGTFLNAVFAYTYSRFAGSEKVYFNFTEHGRHDGYSQDALGLYIRTVPVLVNCKNDSITNYLNNYSDLVLNSMVNSIYPFRLLASEFDLANDVLFEYNSDLNDVTHIDDDLIIEDKGGNLVSDFSAIVNNLSDGFVIQIEHSEKYSQKTAVRFVEAFSEILTQMLDAENLADIDYVSESDLDILDSYNQTDYPLDYEDILDAFNENLAKNPDNRLVSFNDKSYSYSEGAYIAREMADRLKYMNVDAGDSVAFFLTRSEWYLFSILGILSNGSVFVPLDINLPDGRLRFMVEDSSSKVVIVDDNTFERAKVLFDEVTLFNVSEIDINGRLSELPVDYGNLACILYTSGTTGVPKGVKNTRKSILNVCAFYADKYDLDNDDVYGLFSAIGFDVTIFVINAVLYAGACLSVVGEDIRLNMNKMNEYFISQNVSHAFITTQVAKLFMSSVDCSYLDLLLVIGEKLGEVESSDDYLIVDAYGPTEAFAFVTAIENSEKIDYSSVGLIDYNMKSYVLDDELRRVPIGAVGELYLSGNQLADGYLNRDEETRKAFLTNPFEDNDDYNIMYKTGDNVRVLPDGTIGFIGRLDTQVKIRGNRVELSEIEAVIREIDYIDDCTVQTIKNGTNNEVVAYVVVADEFDDDSLKKSISDYVGERKPEYMIPSYVVKLDSIPLNVNGKVDKRALPEVDIEGLHAKYVAPTNRTEKLVVEAFEEVFNQDNIGIYDDFIRLGGDSLTAIKLLAYLGDYNVTAGDVLSLRTPFAIASNIKGFNLNMDVYDIDDGCPLSESQLNVYLDIVANNKVNSYRIPLAMKLSGKFGVNEISDALNKILDVHPILNMCIDGRRDVPRLVKSLKPSVVVAKDATEKFIREFLSKPFDLHHNLSRFMIVENSDLSCSLFAVFHHIVFDALSDRVFKKDLMTILNRGTVDLDDSFLKVAAFNEQIKGTDEYIEANDFYDRMLADSEEAGVLLDSISSEGPGFCQINLDLDDSFKEFLNNFGVSENVVFTSVFAYTLSRFVGDDKVLFNIVENGRDRFNNHKSIGMFVNTLPLFVDCKNQAVSLFMDYMSDTIYSVMKYNYYPFRLLAKKYNVDSNIIFQFIPDWVDSEYEEINDIDLEIQDLVGGMQDFIIDFNVDLIQQGSDYYLNITYSDSYSKDMVAHFIELYKLILSQLTDADRLSDIKLISEEDTKLLDSFNQTEYPLEYYDILDAFNYNLSKYPDNPLVSYKDSVYTYAEGAFIADKLASALKENGVGENDCVAFLVERSELYLFSILSVLSLGAIFVPLDDMSPDGRNEFILNDTQSKVVIVSDATCERVRKLGPDLKILNLSGIVKEGIGTLDKLPVNYNGLGCVLYTSGTTGVPKGVKINRISFVNLSQYYIRNYNFTKDDVFGLYSSIV